MSAAPRLSEYQTCTLVFHCAHGQISHDRVLLTSVDSACSQLPLSPHRMLGLGAAAASHLCWLASGMPPVKRKHTAMQWHLTVLVSCIVVCVRACYECAAGNVSAGCGLRACGAGGPCMHSTVTRCGVWGWPRAQQQGPLPAFVTLGSGCDKLRSCCDVWTPHI